MIQTWAFRYFVYGALFGLLFPIGDALAALARRGLPVSLDTIALIQFGADSGFDRWAIDAIPLVLGGALFLAGRQRDRRERDMRRLSLIGDIRSVLNAAAGLDTLLNALAPKWARLAGARECYYATWDGQSDTPLPIHPRSPYDEKIASRPITQDGTPLAKWVIEHNVVKTLGRSEAALAALAVPLAVNNRAIGVALFVDTRPEYRYHHDDAAALLAVADQVALQIDHIRSGVEIRRRARDMEAISQVARRLAAGWDIDRILATIAESTQVRFGMDYVGILVVDDEAGEFVMRAQSGPLSLDSASTHRQKLTEGSSGRAYASGQQVLARDVRQEPDYVTVTGADIRSELVIPLRSGERVVGVILFGSRYPDAFHQEDILALQMLADQVAVAVENARLFEEAQRERQRLSAVLASTGDAVIVTDAADRVQLFNRAAERFFGTPAAQAVGARLEDTLRLPDLLNAYRASPEAHVFELALSNTTTLLGNLTPVRDEELGLLGRVLTLHDISYLKRLDQLKSQMIHMASHDLRNPLYLAFGYLGLLQDAVADRPETHRFTDELNGALKRMKKLIEDLLDVERIESATDRVRQPIDLNDVARHAADELRSQADSQRHELLVQSAADPALVSADPVQMQQVAVNLVSNAIKYTLDAGRICVRVRRDADRVVFEVEDNGLGIPLAARAKLFQRFYRVKMKGTEDIEGAGLGLSLVKAIVEQHRGTIEVDSEEGRGSVFRICLPALAEPAAETERSVL